MELGVFVLFSLFGFLGFWRRTSLTVTGFSLAIFFVIAVLLSTGQEVVATTQTPAHNVTSSSSEIQYNATGNLVYNTTKTETTHIPESDSAAVVIDDHQVAFSWLFFGLAIVMTFMFTKNAFSLAGWNM